MGILTFLEESELLLLLKTHITNMSNRIIVHDQMLNLLLLSNRFFSISLSNNGSDPKFQIKYATKKDSSQPSSMFEVESMGGAGITGVLSSPSPSSSDSSPNRSFKMFCGQTMR